MTAEEKAETITWLTTNCSCWKESKATLEAMTDDQVASLQAAAEIAANAGKDDDDEEEDDEDDEEEETAPPPAKGKKMAANADDDDETETPTGNRELTMNEWLQAMPPEARSVWQNAVEIEKRERATLVGKLTANVTGDARTRLTKRLNGKPLDELRDLLAMVPEPAPTADDYPAYYGAAGGPPTTNAKDDSDNVLPVFNYDFGEPAK